MFNSFISNNGGDLSPVNCNKDCKSVNDVSTERNIDNEEDGKSSDISYSDINLNGTNTGNHSFDIPESNTVTRSRKRSTSY